MGLGYKYVWRGTRKTNWEQLFWMPLLLCLFLCFLCLQNVSSDHKSKGELGQFLMLLVDEMCASCFSEAQSWIQVIQSQLLRWLLFKRNLMLYLLLLFHSKDYCFNRRHKKGEFKIWISMIQSHFIIELDLTGILSWFRDQQSCQIGFLCIFNNHVIPLEKRKRENVAFLSFFYHN